MTELLAFFKWKDDFHKQKSRSPLEHEIWIACAERYRDELKALRESLKPAVTRFQQIVEYLECECDSYNGFTCTLHKDREIAKAALATLLNEPPPDN